MSIQHRFVTVCDHALIFAEAYFRKFRIFFRKLRFFARSVAGVAALPHVPQAVAHERRGSPGMHARREYLSCRQPLSPRHIREIKHLLKWKIDCGQARAQLRAPVVRHAYRPKRNSIGVFPRYLFMVVARWL